MTDFTATHAAPDGGLRAWAAPDPSQQPITTIQARVEMIVLEQLGDWAHIECSNGWSAWVDARKLVAQHAPAPTPPPATSEPSPRPAAATTANAVAEFLARPVMTVGERSLVVQDLIPAAGIILGALLSWFRIKHGPSSNSFDVPLLFLLDYKTRARTLKLGWLLLVAAGVSVAPLEKRFHQIALGVTAGVCVLFIIQLQRVVGVFGGHANILDFIGFGTIITLAAAGAGLYWSTRSPS
jgi:hypothetical protein